MSRKVSKKKTRGVQRCESVQTTREEKAGRTQGSNGLEVLGMKAMGRSTSTAMPGQLFLI